MDSSLHANMFFFLSFVLFWFAVRLSDVGFAVPPLFVYSIYLKWAFPSFHVKMALLIKRYNSSWEQNMDSVFSHSLVIFLLGIRLLFITIAWKCMHQFLSIGCFSCCIFLNYFGWLVNNYLFPVTYWMCLSFFFKDQGILVSTFYTLI